MATITTKKWVKGKLVESKEEHVDFKPNQADLDIVLVGCDCGNQFDMPWDAVAFGGLGENSFCGGCGKSGTMKVISDPSPNKLPVEVEEFKKS